MKKLHLALTLLTCATTMPAQTSQTPPAHPVVEYAVKIFIAGMLGYITYDVGKILGWWAYPTSQELLTEIDETTKKLDGYTELIAAFTAAEDDCKEDALRIMASKLDYVTIMVTNLFYTQCLIKKINGRLHALRSAQETKDEAAITLLEHHAAMLQVQADTVEQMIAFSKKHTDYFKLYALEQKMNTMCARELQLYELFKDDIDRLQTELLNHSSYAHRQHFGLLTFVNKLHNMRTECEYALIRQARAYPQFKQLLEQRINALYKIEQAIASTTSYINLDAEHEELLAQSDDEYKFVSAIC